jgi:hypothetical protein
MLQRSSRLLLAAVFCGTALSVASPATAQQKEFSSANRKIGNAAVEYRDKTIHVVAAYYHSQRNHDSRWLLIESALSTTEDSVIKRENIVLRTPQGREIPLATQRRVGEDVKRVEQLLQNAKVQTHPVASYFNQRDRIEDMKMFRLPFGPVVHDEFVSDRDHVAVGPLFFEAPTGAWEKGTYALIVRHPKGVAEMPIVLE